ncbi:NAD(P)-binding protein [Amniculicola lignicola CBS 123094]|uniref:NAD(P)-binding protein n=1 Tax=Amniculicola lignicola CBS 123094 TaxID=1392246 RepID=A0A6A5VW93_9PLEO|nr:NAD(P)-binding protein [Amniculicola lignicola CBS 123094]
MPAADAFPIASSPRSRVLRTGNQACRPRSGEGGLLELYEKYLGQDGGCWPDVEPVVVRRHGRAASPRYLQERQPKLLWRKLLAGPGQQGFPTAGLHVWQLACTIAAFFPTPAHPASHAQASKQASSLVPFQAISLPPPPAMSVLITGASGFVGQTLARALLSLPSPPALILADLHTPPNPLALDSGIYADVQCIAADLTDPATCVSLLSRKPAAVYILHGIMSSGSEADLELGLKVNFDSVRSLLDAVRRQGPGTKVVFTSSCAVYGRAAVTNVANEVNVVPMPESSYGTQKLMIEGLVNDYSRRGLIDGRVVRLPTVFVRAGAPTAAASSFVSGIVREPVNGEEAILPVDASLGIWLVSPQTLAKNLIHAMNVPAEKFGHFRTVLLPGYTASSREILDALEKVAGKEVRSRVREERDETVQRIVLSWPAKYDTSRAKALGFSEDVGLEQTIRDFIEREKSKAS